MLLIYATLFLTVIVQEEAAPLAGALAAHHGHGALWLAALSCAAGSWAGDLVLYFAGLRSTRFLRRPGFARVLRVVQEHPRAAPLAVRFAYGMRLSLPIACGVARVPPLTFALWSAISALSWAALFSVLGWGAGEFAIRWFREAEHYELPFAAVAVAAGLALFLVNRLRAARLEPGPDPTTGDA